MAELIDRLPMRDLVGHATGGGWGAETAADGTSPVAIIRGADFPEVATGDARGLPVRWESDRKIPQRMLEPGDIVLEISGGTDERPTGRTVFVTERLLAQHSIPVIPASFCRLIRVDPGKVDPRYAYYWLQSMYEAGRTWEYQNRSTGLSNFQFNYFLDAEVVDLPPLDEQRRIAHILGTLDDKIELNRRMNETLEEMARALFQSWFVDFDPVRAKAEGRDPGLPKHLADLFPDRLVDSELGEIPEGWAVGALGEIAEQLRRRVKSGEIPEGTPYIGLEHMPRRSISLSDWDNADSVASGKSAFRKGEILFGKLRPYFHKVGIAPVDGVCSTDIVVLRAKQSKWTGFALHLVSSDSFVDFTAARSAGTRMPRTSWSDMAEYGVAIPSTTIAEAFESIVHPIVGRLSASSHLAKTLTSLRDSLLRRFIGDSDERT